MRKDKLYIIILILAYLTSLAFHLCGFFFNAGFSEFYFILFLLIFSGVPYYFCFLLLFFSPLNTVMMFGVFFSLLIDLYCLYTVFLAPQSSTAGLNLLTAPIMSLLMNVFLFVAGKIINCSRNE
ncbi:hypothetical protein [Pantoea ananatis]|uniref:hypothetical protein n=1 Tax=Pantoea ananas TaxID=553 RepID=UPI0024ADD35B|nr:hypothetical protein [Pantoea ananatis]